MTGYVPAGVRPQVGRRHRHPTRAATGSGSGWTRRSRRRHRQRRRSPPGVARPAVRSAVADLAVSAAGQRSDRVPRSGPSRQLPQHGGGSTAGQRSGQHAVGTRIRLTWPPTSAARASTSRTTTCRKKRGQDQRQRSGQGVGDACRGSASGRAHWCRRSPATTAAIAAALDGSAADTPLFAVADRRLDARRRPGRGRACRRAPYGQGRASKCSRCACDEAFAFAVTDEDEAEEAGFSDGGACIHARRAVRVRRCASDRHGPRVRAGHMAVDDRAHARGGLRFDRSSLLLAATAMEPAARRWRTLAVDRDDAARVGQPLLPAAATRAPAARRRRQKRGPLAVRRRTDDRGGGADARTRAAVGVRGRRRASVRQRGSASRRRLLARADRRSTPIRTCSSARPSSSRTPSPRGRARGVDVAARVAAPGALVRLLQLQPRHGRAEWTDHRRLFLEDDIADHRAGRRVHARSRSAGRGLGRRLTWSRARGRHASRRRPLRERHAGASSTTTSSKSWRSVPAPTGSTSSAAASSRASWSIARRRRCGSGGPRPAISPPARRGAQPVRRRATRTTSAIRSAAPISARRARPPCRFASPSASPPREGPTRPNPSRAAIVQLGITQVRSRNIPSPSRPGRQ